jgi:hypothetical protein
MSQEKHKYLIYETPPKSRIIVREIADVGYKSTCWPEVKNKTDL